MRSTRASKITRIFFLTFYIFPFSSWQMESLFIFFVFIFILIIQNINDKNPIIQVLYIQNRSYDHVARDNTLTSIIESLNTHVHFYAFIIIDISSFFFFNLYDRAVIAHFNKLSLELKYCYSDRDLIWRTLSQM